MIRIVGRSGACAQHFIVTCPFSLQTQPPRRKPDQRIEPVQRARDLGNHLGETVAALNVSQLVEQDQTPAIITPIIRIRR
jgi:hypothetical protein